MSLSPTNPLADYQTVFVFLVARLEAAGVSDELHEQSRGVLAQLDGIEAEQTATYRQEITYRAIIAGDNSAIDDAMFELDSSIRMADRHEPTLHLRARLIGDAPISEIIRPSGTGLARQLDALDLILGKESLLPPAPALPSIHDQMAALRNQAATARRHLAQLNDALAQQSLLSARSAQLKYAARAELDKIRGQLMTIYPSRRDTVNSFFFTPSRRADKESQQGTDKPKQETDEPPSEPNNG